MAEEFKIKTSIELDDKKARKQLASLKTSAKENNIKLNVEMNTSSLNNLKQLENTLKQINKLSRETQNGLFGGKGNSNGNINKLTSQYDNFRKKIESTQRQLKKFTQTNILDNKQIGEINKLSGELKRLSNIKLGGLNSKALSDLSNVQSKLANMKIPDMNTKMASQFKTLQNEAGKLANKIETLGKSGYADTSKLQALSNSLKSIQNLNLKNLTSNQIQSEIQKLEQLKNKVKEVENTTKNTKLDAKFNMNLSRVISDLNRLRQKCLELGQSTAGIDKLEKELMQLNGMPLGQKVKELDAIKSRLSNMKSNFTGLGTSVKATSGFFSDLYNSMRTYTLGNMIGMSITNGVRNIKTTIVELDSALRDMMKVAPDNFEGTSEQLKNVKNEAISIGKDTARASEDIIQGASKALQTGVKSVSDSLKIAKQSAVFANVGDLDQETANKYLTSVMSAYGGMTKALKPIKDTRVQIKGMSKDYDNLTKFLDLSNYAG